jgi:hypothetical protein
MRKCFGLLLLGLVFAASACAAEQPHSMPAVTSKPAVKFPPTWTPTPGAPVTAASTIVPRPTRTIGSAATPAASVVYTATDALFTFEFPSNWASQSGARQMVSVGGARQMNYAAFNAPGTAPQPAILIFYKWPNSSPISNGNAWEQAYAVASVAAKVCPMTLTTGGPIEIGGENGKYIGYEDGCGVQGEVIGFVHNRVNYGILIEAPQPLWEEWRPILRDFVGTLKFP